MSWKENIVKKLYAHKYGIMGTVIFHLLLAILLLSMEIAGLRQPERVEIELAAPPEQVRQKLLEEKLKKEEIRKRVSREEIQKMLRSIAVNENVESRKQSGGNVERYIEEIREELDRNQSSSGRYKPKKDRNYKSDSLQHATDKKEAMLDSLKSTFYSGKSSVSYKVEGRFARLLPIPVFQCEFGGKVVVRIAVNRGGAVQRAVVSEADSDMDECLHEAAVNAALRSRFNEKPDAPVSQTGTITYHFVKQ
ncbi:energy transducer TonB [Odoribacter lunatus]|uniref:energy transducer TonB n=1 Tax=Odoribacter lunatus TaxID=2941335 RepID=UPI00203C9E6E|nr:energy transducer TonB [Odoribacter lunatus]